MADNLNFNVTCNVTVKKNLKKNSTHLNITDSASSSLKISSLHNESIAFTTESKVKSQLISKVSESLEFTTEVNVDAYNKTTINNNISFDDTTKLILTNLFKRYFKNKVYSLLGTLQTQVYQCTDENATVLNICLCNRTLQDISADVILNNGLTYNYILKGLNIPKRQSYVLSKWEDGSPIQLIKNDAIIMQSDTDSSLDVFMSLMITKKG